MWKGSSANLRTGFWARAEGDCGFNRGMFGGLRGRSLFGPGVQGNPHLGRGFYLRVQIFYEDLVGDARVAVLFGGVTVHAPEAVLLLASEHLLNGLDAGVGEGGTDVLAVADHGVVEAAEGGSRST